MARAPLRSAVPRPGRLALALSVAVHGLFLALLWLLPEGAPQTDGPPAVSTVVLLADDEPGVTPAPQPAAAGPGTDRELLVSPVVLPDTPTAVDPASAPAEETAPAPLPATGSAPGPAGGGAAGGRPGASFFQVPAEGTSVVYVIDCSASMGLGDGLAAAKRELLASLRQLPASARFQVVFYNRDADVLHVGGSTDLLPASAENVAETGRLLERLRAGGSTNHLQALRRALALEADVLFLVTDAADLSPEQVRLVTQWNGGRTAIHAIELGGRDDAGSPLELLARTNRGKYRAVSLAAGE